MSAHLLVLPVVLPLLAAGLLLLLERSGIGLQRAVGLGAAAGQLLLALMIAVAAGDGTISVYLLGNWPAQLGIALAADRLTAIMLLTTAALGLAGVLYAAAGWDRRAPHFHTLFQLLLMGLNGAFLTADLFNLFVFFEVLLIASYGLMLSGGRGARMRAGLHYVVFNIAASTLYLVAVGLLYGLLGALSIAELGERIASAPVENHALIAAAGGLLLIVFCAKAALFPLYLWLPETYARTPAPVVALFAVMTKLGVYAVLRIYTVMFGDAAGPLAGLAWPWLLPAAAAGLALASLGVVAARSLRALVGYLVVGSAATLFIAVALDEPDAVGAGLYYLIHSSLVAAALFLLADLIRRQRVQAGDDLTRIDRLPAKRLLGPLFFIACLSIIGLPPLSGFIGKFALLAAISGPAAGWVWPLLLVSSLLVLIALANAGSQLFWRGADDGAAATAAAAARPLEIGAIVLLLGLGIAISVAAAPVLRYTQAAADQLAEPAGYRAALLGAQPRPPASAAATEEAVQ
jgi:multicomponent K+:H+ antiporter subunit D